jgi:hypothetical protein
MTPTGASSSLTGWPLMSTPRNFSIASSASATVGKAMTLRHQSGSTRRHSPRLRAVAVDIGPENRGAAHSSIILEIL